MLSAAIFDMDGLLIDSEPLWQQAERQLFASAGLELTSEMCQRTKGLRIDEVVQYWYSQRPWSDPAPEELPPLIIARVIELVKAEGQPQPGAKEAVSAARDVGLALALATSSPPSLIDAVLDRLDLSSTFEVIHSAVDERYGKPHPAVFLTAAERLAIEPTQCLAFEDSLNGVIAAKAARMTCIAVPEAFEAKHRGFEIADVVLSSLLDIDQAMLEGLRTA